MNVPSRPVVRWHGGKWKLAAWIIAHFPAHRVYVEPFGGGGSVLLRKPRSYAEVYNDLDQEVVTLFRVLRDPGQSARLIDLLRLTPFAREEFNGAYDPASDPVEISRRLLIRSYMGFGSDGVNSERRTGFRANSNRSGTTPAHDWAHYPDVLPTTIERLQGIVIENRCAVDVMAAHDGPDTLHYVDPPYVHATRSRKSRRRGVGGVAAYRHEMSDADHVDLLIFLDTLDGMVVLSGYPHPLYDDALADWQRVTCETHADGARDRTEVLWINPACARRMRDKGPLFEAVA
jgi:DNA adenine methylase